MNHVEGGHVLHRPQRPVSAKGPRAWRIGLRDVMLSSVDASSTKGHTRGDKRTLLRVMGSSSSEQIGRSLKADTVCRHLQCHGPFNLIAHNFITCALHSASILISELTVLRIAFLCHLTLGSSQSCTVTSLDGHDWELCVPLIGR